MRKFRVWVYVAIVAQILATGLAWVVNGDIISSVLISLLAPLSFAALGLAATPFVGSTNVRSLLRIETVMLFLLSAAALLLAISGNSATSSQPLLAGQALVVDGFVSALLVLTIGYGLWRDQVVSFGIAAIGVVAAAGIIASNIDSIDLMVIAVARAVMILFLVLLAQSLDPEVATT